MHLQILAAVHKFQLICHTLLKGLSPWHNAVEYRDRRKGKSSYIIMNSIGFFHMTMLESADLQ